MIRISCTLFTLATFAANAQMPPRVLNDLLLAGSLNQSKAFSPNDVAGLVRWFDVQSISASNGDLISSVPDKSISGDYLTNGASAQRPYWTNTAAMNGHPALYFNGSSSQLTNANVADASKTLILVICGGSTYIGRVPFSVTANAEIYGINPNTWRYYAPSSGPMTGATNANVFIIKWTSLSVAADRGGSGAWSADFNPHDDYDNSTTFWLGSEVGSLWFMGWFGELLVYDSALSDSDVNLLGNYLANKWGISWSNL